MPFRDYEEVKVRLAAESTPLTDAEIRDMLPFVPRMLEGAHHRFQAELTHRNIVAIRDFERSSTRVAVVMIVMSVLQVIMTAANVYFYFCAVRR